MKNLKSNSWKVLNRKEQKVISGGTLESATCSANCPDGSVITCTGPECTAADGVGCTTGNRQFPCLNVKPL
ncbi:hypothetical protein [Ascidiimonas aurantiaca]|uniref:hypothetical protein n=1 Tax=Ascidiimonas aurantiaca TaxID=1685432 RepID=UPI0030EC8D8E